MVHLDYSRVARSYVWLERAVFGSVLQAARTAFLTECVKFEPASAPLRVLLVGDGDGRFLKQLLASFDALRVDYVDRSPGMLKLARERVASDPRVSWFCADIADVELGTYDLVVAHFVLDGFPTNKAGGVIQRLVDALSKEGALLVSDFDEEVSLRALCLVRVMQFFFYCTAQQPKHPVVRHDIEFEQRGLVKCAEKQWWGGAIFSQMWKM